MHIPMQTMQINKTNIVLHVCCLIASTQSCSCLQLLVYRSDRVLLRCLFGGDNWWSTKGLPCPSKRGLKGKIALGLKGPFRNRSLATSKELLNAKRKPSAYYTFRVCLQYLIRR